MNIHGKGFCNNLSIIFSLWTALIKQLHRDKYISAEEASQLTSTKLFTAPDTVKNITRTTNIITGNTNGAFTSALFDTHESSNNSPLISTTVQYTVQSHTNTVDVTENLNDDVLQHISSESEIEHGPLPHTSLLAHNQQGTTTKSM